MASNGKIPVELTPEQMADLIDAATRAAEQDQEDAEILSSQPRIDRETVGMLLETRKRLLTLAAWMQHCGRRQRTNDAVHTKDKSDPASMREGLPGTCAGMQRDVLLMDAVSVHPGAHLSKAARREARAGTEFRGAAGDHARREESKEGAFVCGKIAPITRESGHRAGRA